MFVEGIAGQLNSADPKLRGEAQVAAALALELSRIPIERRSRRLPEFQLLGLELEAALGFALNEEQMGRILDGLFMGLRRYGEGTAIWALGKAEPDLVADRSFEILNECMGVLDEEAAWQYGCVIEVWLSLGCVKSVHIPTISELLDRISEIGSQRLLRLRPSLEKFR